MATDEARRAVQHDSIKSGVVDEINNEVASRATGLPSLSEARRIEQAAGTIREHAVDEVIESERAVQRSRGLARVSQFADYAFFLVYALLAIRFFLAIVGARPTAGFVQFISAISDPVFAPFRNIVESPAVGSGRVLLPAVIAMLAYGVLHLAINRALRMIVARKTEI